MRLTLTLAASLLLSACGDGGDQLAPGGVTESEASILNDAAAMLDENATLPEAVGIENTAD